MSEAAVQPARRYVNLQAGDPAPWFVARTTKSDRFTFNTVAGRYIVLCFFISAQDPNGSRRLVGAAKYRKVFDDERAAFFGVTLDPADERRLNESVPGVRFFLDFDGAVSREYGVLPLEGGVGERGVTARPIWFILGPTLRVVAAVPFAPDGSDVEQVFETLNALPPPDLYAGFESPPPVLVLPDVFEPQLCSDLIRAYEMHGGEESGFMREENGVTVPVHDASHKRRRDHVLEDQALIARARESIRRRVVPEIMKVHQFEVTRMERHIVACYSAEDGGHFRRHRDNTTKGTAHRRFAVSINLNSEFEGGELNFPEYGRRSFKPGRGAAVVFSCSLLHQVSPVTAGRRYAYLPFLYDEAGAKLREANLGFVDRSLANYKAG